MKADIVKEIEPIREKKEFNRLKNPDDLIRIAIFDLWVDNADRRGENYNLLLKMEEGKLKFIAIDHAFTFGGLSGMNIFNASTLPNSYRKLIESQYFRSVVKHFNKSERLEITNQFVSLVSHLDIEKIINEAFAQIPEQWEINPTLRKRIIDFLQSNQRIITLQQICTQALQEKIRR